jgi:hypothetical protein
MLPSPHPNQHMACHDGESRVVPSPNIVAPWNWQELRRLIWLIWLI